MATRAREWATLPATGTTQVTDWGAITLEGSDPTRNVFILAGADLARATDLTIRVPAGATALINIDGTSNRMQYFGITLDGPTAAQVVYNMPQATELTLDGIGVRGSIVAPHAAISFPNGNIDGTLIGASLTGRGEAHHVPPAVCLPELPPTPTPTPTATETPTATATGTATATATATATSTATATPTSTPTPTVPPLDNLPPRVDAGPDQVLSLEQTSTYLDGQAVDDGLPFGTLTVTWTLVHGPIDLFLADTGSVNSLVRTVPGTYTLRLTASDGALHASDEMQLRITDAAQMPDLAAISVNAGALTVQGQTLQAAGTVSAVVANPGPTAITGTVTLAFFEEQAVGARRLATSTLDGPASGATTTVTATVTGDLLFPGNRISVLVDPDDHLAETDETNNIAHTRSTCEDLPPTSIFSPTLEWEWTGSPTAPTSNRVVMTPAVLDLNGDAIPDILFTTYAGSSSAANGRLRALSGDTGAELFTNTTHDLRGTGQLAVGDLDPIAGDGPEILAVAEGGTTLIAFDRQGQFVWESAPIAGGIDRGGAALADLDMDGTPEIVIGATVLDANGNLPAQGPRDRGNNGVGPLSLVADLDMDGTPEIIAGRTAYRYRPGTPTLEVLWHTTSFTDAGGTPRSIRYDGFNAVGDFDADPFPEVVLVTRGSIYLLQHDGTVAWGPVTLTGGGRGGAPTVANLDADDRPEIGVAGARNYVTLKADGQILWESPVNDTTSHTTGSSVFDFDGDGQVEVVYGDEYRLRIYRGSTGEVLWSTPSSSVTGYELPVIADVDGDGNAEIVEVSNPYHRMATTGIQVYGDRNDAWVATRPLWNQHTYHITNINDDGTIPAREANNWETFNNYRLNTFLSGCATARPDLTASYVRLARETTSLTLTARIGNGGGLFVPAGVPVSWYAGAPANRDLLGTVTTTQRLEPGQYTDIALTLPVGTTTESPVWVVADDQGAGTGRHTEVSETNNAHNAHLYLSATPNTPPVVDAVPDQGTAFYTPAGRAGGPRRRRRAAGRPPAGVLDAGEWSRPGDVGRPHRPTDDGNLRAGGHL